MRLVPKNWREFQHYKDRNPPWIRLHHKLLDNRDFNALPPMACKVLVLLWLLASESTSGEFEGNAEELSFRLRLPSKDVGPALQVLMAKGFLLPAGEQVDSEDGRPLSKQIAESNGFGSRHISDKTKRAVWVRDDGKCCHCGSEESIEYDHKTPVSAGGNSDEANVWLLCRPCNRKKRTKTVEQFATHAQLASGQAYSEAEAEARQRQTPKPPSGADARFEQFWNAYPKKVGKDAAHKAFDKREPDDALLARMLAAVGVQRSGDAWLKDGGQFIPNPSTWLNQGRWQDGESGSGDSAEVGEWHETRGGVEKRAVLLGMPKWDECEQWLFYRARVVAAAKEAA